MRKFLMAAIPFALAPFAADATVTVSSTAYALTAPAGEGTLIDFDSALPTGFTLTGTGYLIQSGTNTKGAAPAAGPTNATDDATKYLSVFAGSAKLLGTTAYSNVSLFWGSMDSYNALDLLDASGNSIATIVPSAIPAGDDGDQLAKATNRRVDIASTDAFYGLQFRSTAAAFEADNVKFSGATGAVPEPASWAMMLVGFGGLGGAMRRNRARSRTIFA